MARIGSDGENISLPVWLYGYDDKRAFRWYCVDVADDNIFMQKEVRLDRKRKLIQIQERDEVDDEDEDVVPITFPPGKLGLRIQPHSTICPVIEFQSTCVLGSSIYCVASQAHSCFDSRPLIQDLHWLDTTDLISGWRTFRMNTGRLRPQMAALDGKLYIFRGPRGRGFESELGLDNREGEILDPQTGQTESIPPVPLEFEDRLIFITVLVETKQIVFCSNDYIYLVYYNVKNRKWIVEYDSMHRNQLQIIRNYACSVVGTTIYCFSSYYFMVSAYDFAHRKFYEFNCSLKNDFSQHGNNEEDFSTILGLLHLRDDYFCLAWTDAQPFTDPQEHNYSQIRCTKMQISLDKDHESLSPSLLSTQTYLLDRNCRLMSALLVNPNMEQTIGRRSGIISVGEDNSNARKSKCKQLIVSAQDSVTQGFKLEKITAALEMQTSQALVNWNYFPEKLKAMEYRRMSYKQDEPWENEKEVDELKVEILKLQNFIQATEKFATEFQEEKLKLKNIIEEIKIICNRD